MKQKVFISILDFNGHETTLACLKSLQGLDTTDIELHVVVVDNGSTLPLHVDPAKYEEFTLHPIRSATNTGFAGGHNIGIHFALERGAEYVMVLNDDVQVHKDLLQELLKGIQKQKNAGAVLPKIYFAKGSEFHKDRYKPAEKGKVVWYAGGIMDWDNIIGINRGVDEVDHGQYDKVEETQLMTGCCVLFKREVLEKTKGFDERYFLYYEDADLTQRIKKLGYSIYYIPSAILWHSNAQSTGGSGSSLQDYYISRNRLLFGFSYASLRTKIALLRESLRLLKHGRPGQQQGVKDFYLRRFGKGVNIP